MKKKNQFWIIQLVIIIGLLSLAGFCEREKGPTSPSDLTASLISGNKINLSWSDNSTDEWFFWLEVKTGTGAFLELALLEPNTTNYTDVGLAPSTNYSYRVIAVGEFSESYSNKASVTTTVAPSGGSIETVTIGTQVWMKKNLDITRYNNGDPIPQIINNDHFSRFDGTWCYYNNDPTNGDIYGKLYNWYTINDPRGITPAGWHLPTEAEWNTLALYLGGFYIAGGKMKSVGTVTFGTGLWSPPNNEATNSSNFTGLPGGWRPSDFKDIGTATRWWIDDESNLYAAKNIYLSTNSGEMYVQDQIDKSDGCSVRLIKD